MTEQNNPEQRPTIEAFVVGEWADYCETGENKKIQITDVTGTEVTARVHFKPMVFTPRSSDGKFVKKGTLDNDLTPAMLVYAPPKNKWKEFRNILGAIFTFGAIDNG